MFKGKKEIENMDTDDTILKLKETMKKIPLLKDVIEHMSELEINERRQIKITIATQDYERCENITFEKILK